MNNTGARWTITGQQEIRQQAPNGQFASGIVVTYKTLNNVTGTVFFPYAEYNVDNVRKVISERVALHNGIGELTG